MHLTRRCPLEFMRTFVIHHSVTKLTTKSKKVGVTCIPEVVTRTLSSAQLQAAEAASGHTPFVVLVLATHPLTSLSLLGFVPISVSLRPSTSLICMHRTDWCTYHSTRTSALKDSPIFHNRRAMEYGINSSQTRSVVLLTYS